MAFLFSSFRARSCDESCDLTTQPYNIRDPTGSWAVFIETPVLFLTAPGSKMHLRFHSMFRSLSHRVKTVRCVFYLALARIFPEPNAVRAKIMNAQLLESR